jgi:GNAT superfamily N-acetyltransferase
MDVGEAALRAQAEWFWTLAASGFELLAVDGGFAVATGLDSNTENGAVIAPEIAARPGELDRLLAWLHRRGVPASIVASGPLDGPAVAALTARGLVPDNTATDMGLTLTGPATPTGSAGGGGPATPAAAAVGSGRVAAGGGVVVGEVLGSEELLDSLAVYVEDGWYRADEVAAVHAAAVQVGFGPRHAVRHWVARRDGGVVGAATSFRFGTGVALVRCCVRKAARRRGIGTALSRARLEGAVSDGATHAVVAPSADGFRLHRSLGFVAVRVPPDRLFHLR